VKPTRYKTLTRRFIFSTFFCLIANLLFAQSFSAPDSLNDMLLKMRCPKAYAQIGKPLPEFSLKYNGRILNNDSLKGKVVIINFWFEGCHPCMAEMDALNELFEKLKSNKDFRFVSISTDNEETINRVKQKFAIKYDIIPVTKKECSQIMFECGFPLSIVINKKGVINYFHADGSIKKEEAREGVITELLPRIISIL
jgi:peroxiredoxin